MRSLAFQFRVSHQYISVILNQTFTVIKERLMSKALPVPTEQKFSEIAKQYFKRWDYPNCVGAIDGKHVRIVCPANSGSSFFNYKDYFSIVLLALVDADYKFTAIDVGAYGREGDSGVFHRSEFGKKIIEGNFNIPPPKDLPGTTVKLPHVVVGDEAFALYPNLMRSFPRKQAHSDRQKAVYNYRHSRARRTSENAFGIMASYFRIFFSPINVAPDTVNNIVIAACIFHNLMRDAKIVAPHQVSIDDIENLILPTQNLITMNSCRRRQTRPAYKIREQFMEYFNDVGARDWQDEYIYRH